MRVLAFVFAAFTAATAHAQDCLAVAAAQDGGGVSTAADGASPGRELLAKLGMDPPPPNTPEQFADIVKKDAARWAAAVEASGAKVD